MTGPAGLLGLVARSLQVAGPRASMCGLPRGAQPGYFPYWPAALPFAQLPRALGFPPGTPGTRGDRFQARCFYSGVGETEALNHGSPGRRFARKKKLLVTVANAKCAKYLFAQHIFLFFLKPLTPPHTHTHAAPSPGRRDQSPLYRKGFGPTSGEICLECLEFFN